MIFSMQYWMEKAMAPHSNILVWKISWTEELGRLQSIGRKESDTAEHSIHTHRKTKHRAWHMTCTKEILGLITIIIPLLFFNLMYFVSDFLLLKPGLAPFKI